MRGLALDASEVPRYYRIKITDGTGTMVTSQVRASDDDATTIRAKIMAEAPEDWNVEVYPA